MKMNSFERRVCQRLHAAPFAEDTPAFIAAHTRERTAVVVVVAAASVCEGVVYMYFNYALTSFRLIKTTADPERTAKFANKQTVA